MTIKMLAGFTHWTELWSGFLGVVVGCFIPIGISRWARRTERLGELAAMRAEMFQAHLCMNAIRGTDLIVAAPLYRLPQLIFKVALPKLIGEGKLTQTEVRALLEYVMRIDELNRGLDRAGDAATADAPLRLNDEYSRNVAKVEHVLDSPPGPVLGVSLFDQAEAALRRVERTHWFRPKPPKLKPTIERPQT